MKTMGSLTSSKSAVNSKIRFRRCSKLSEMKLPYCARGCELSHHLAMGTVVWVWDRLCVAETSAARVFMEAARLNFEATILFTYYIYFYLFLYFYFQKNQGWFRKTLKTIKYPTSPRHNFETLSHPMRVLGLLESIWLAGSNVL